MVVVMVVAMVVDIVSASVLVVAMVVEMVLEIVSASVLVVARTTRVRDSAVIICFSSSFPSS